MHDFLKNWVQNYIWVHGLIINWWRVCSNSIIKCGFLCCRKQRNFGRRYSKDKEWTSGAQILRKSMKTKKATSIIRRHTLTYSARDWYEKTLFWIFLFSSSFFPWCVWSGSRSSLFSTELMGKWLYLYTIVHYQGEKSGGNMTMSNIL